MVNEFSEIRNHEWKIYLHKIIDKFYQYFNEIPLYDNIKFANEFNKLTDIFSMGCLIKSLIKISNGYKNNNICNKLIGKMIEFHPKRRITNEYLIQTIPFIVKNEWNDVQEIINQFEKSIKQ